MEGTPISKPRRGLFVVTVLLGSFLLFMVQPLVARMALPRLGGAPAVWNSAMLVYQTLLLAGYLYAHLLGRLVLRRQAAVHLAVLLLAGLTLPITLSELAPPSSGWEPVWVPLLLLLTIGPVFFAISAQAPLLQRWYAAQEDVGDPYWLYAASNLGSFAGLIAYPLLIEPQLRLAEQSWGWSTGYAVLVVLVALAVLSRWHAHDAAVEAPSRRELRPIGPRRIAYWLALAAVPSGLMLSTTTHLTTDIVAMPLLWVIPLGVYLLSFVLAFNERSHLGQVFARVAPFTLLLAGGLAMVSRGTDVMAMASAALLMLLVVTVALHRKLYQDRPHPAQLTLFYLIMSAGGAIGGLFTALIAPVAFDWVYEHPLLVLAAAALLAGRPLVDWLAASRVSPRFRHAALLSVLVVILALSVLLHRSVSDQETLPVAALMVVIAALSLLLLGNRILFVIALLALMLGRGGYETIASSWEGARKRSFFGVYIVRETEMAGLRGLTHGTTLHGLQYTDPNRERQPTSYYTASSGVGMALSQAGRLFGPGARVGIVGLGVGTLACYREPGQSYAFFEIDPQVASYSRDGSFTFLDRCAPRAPIHFGDARLVLADARPGSFDILVIDAFSSDSIPVHLMTREAFAVYKRALSSGGMLLVHISNRYLDLKPVIAALAAESGLHAQLREDLGQQARGASASVWVALSADQDTHVGLVAASPLGAWEALPPPTGRAWSDDYASILPYILWDKLL